MINSTQKVNLCIFSSDIVDMKQRQKCLDLARNAGSYFSFVGMSRLRRTAAFSGRREQTIMNFHFSL